MAQILAALTTGNLESAFFSTRTVLMLGNVLEISAWYFPGSPTVSTYTCTRGAGAMEAKLASRFFHMGDIDCSHLIFS